MSDLHLDDIGTMLRITVKEDNVPIDISQVEVKKLLMLKKNRTAIERDLSFVNDGTDGKVFYLTVSGDIDVKGSLTVQAFLDFPEGQWHTDKFVLTVDDNIVVTP